MKWFITGISGFVGHHLAEYLLSQGEIVAGSFVFDHELENSWLRKHVKQLVRLDVRDKDAVLSQLGNSSYDCIVHLAAQSSIKRSFSLPGETFAINLLGTLNILEAVREGGTSTRVILASSADVYGKISPDRLPLRETTQPFPENPYSISKYSAELLAQAYVKSYSLEVVISRAFNHTGPGQSPLFVIPDFAKQIVEIEAGLREPLIRVGNLEVERDFLDVRDVARAYVAMAQLGDLGEVYHVASGKSYSIKWLLEKLLDMSSMQIKVKVDKNKLRPVEIPVLRGDISKLQQKTGWEPKIPIEKTLEDVLADWRSRMKEQRKGE